MDYLTPDARAKYERVEAALGAAEDTLKPTLFHAVVAGDMPHGDECDVCRAVARVEQLEAGLRIIIRESEQFPDADGIGAGRMAANLLKLAGEPDRAD